MTDSPYGPDKPCQRTGCIANDPGPKQGTAAHLGGAHLDPRDRTHYDGLTTLYVAMPYAVKQAAKPIMLHHKAFSDVNPDSGGDDPRQALEIALNAAFREINRLRQQVAHVQVDADNKVREASRQALDCTAHGDLIRDLEQQVTHHAATAARTERGPTCPAQPTRAHPRVRRPLHRHHRRQPARRPIVRALRSITTRTAAAHQRAWKG
jgi:hypothetical protein